MTSVTPASFLFVNISCFVFPKTWFVLQLLAHKWDYVVALNAHRYNAATPAD